MFQQSSGAGGNKGSGLSRTVEMLGTVIGVGVAILATPVAWRHTRGPLSEYLYSAWGERAGELLSWAFCCVEAAATFLFVKLLFSASAIWAMTAFAARRL